MNNSNVRDGPTVHISKNYISLAHYKNGNLHGTLIKIVKINSEEIAYTRVPYENGI